jgi:DNA polymerase-3 subunit delta
MARDLDPDGFFQRLKDKQAYPCCLFYGPSEFRLEKSLRAICELLIPQSLRDLNFQAYDSDKCEPETLIDAARSVPFLSEHRLIVLRGVEAFSASSLQRFLPYVENPVDSTLLVFISQKPDFKKKLFKRLRQLDASVFFGRLNESQIIPWLRKTAREMGFSIESQACAFLRQIVGNRLRDLHNELEKLYIRYGEGNSVGVEQVKEIALESRSYTVFELMDCFSSKRLSAAILTLKRFLEEEGREGGLKVLGMMNRQMRLLWQTRSIHLAGGKSSDVAVKVKVPVFLATKLIKQSKRWEPDTLEKSFHLLYEADYLIKNGADGHLVLENLIVALCRQQFS